MPDLLLQAPVCVVDVETWCPGAGERHHLVEIGAAVYDRAGRVVRGALLSDGTSSGEGAPWIYQRLCRPAKLPRIEVRFRNGVRSPWLWEKGVLPEGEAVFDFAEWHFACGSFPLVAYNHGFDRAALHGAMAAASGWTMETAETWGLPWGACLMQFAKAVLGKQMGKEDAAAMLFDVRYELEEAARRVDYRGPLEMHRALPDVLLEGEMLCALVRRRRAPQRPAQPAPPTATQAALPL